MRKIQIYIEGVMLDLFNDEQVNLNSTVQNISDISKVFTDFSQSFTVPATKHNNKVFQHWYNSDLEYYDPTSAGGTLSSYDVNIRKDARLELNLTAFRTGKIQLEKANLKDGKVDSYSVTFYGDVTSLKDKFGEDMLSDVDLSTLDHLYTGTEVFNRITDQTTDYDVRYPLISSSRYWTNTGGGADDITVTNGRIVFTELFPAVKIKKLFDVIATHYGVSFNGNFLTNERFTKCFLWAKNTKDNTFVSSAMKVDFASVVYASGSVPPHSSADLTNDKIIYDYNTTTPGISLAPSLAFFVIKFSIVPSNTATTYYIDVHRNGVFSHTVQGSDVNSYILVNDQNTPGLDEEIEIYVRVANSMNIDTSIYCSTQLQFSSGNFAYLDEFTITGATQTIVGNTSLSSLVPEIKVADFFSGVLKTFNLTCYGTDIDTFQIEPLDEWYSLGQIYDITEYTDVSSIDVQRVPLYNKIAFKYQESESVINKQFKALFYREYGNTEQSFPYDGGEFTIELPFENLMGQKFTGTDLLVAFALDENLSPYTPKPCLMYMYTNQTTSVKFFDGTSEQTITNYLPFGQEVNINGQTDFSLNFSADRSTFSLAPNYDNLYATYYESYLLNLFNVRNRLVSVKTQLPISILTKLQLNDRVVIRDKRYVINEMKSNLNTGEVSFTLLLDFREVRIPLVVPTNPGANCVDVPITLGNGVCSVNIATLTAGVTITPSTVTSSQVISVCVPANATPQTLIVTEESNSLLPPILRKYLVTETFENIVTENSSQQSIELTVTETYCNGAVNDYTIFITQP
tara:strand:+ start:869 stop:3262 length:2394 start_codon:yes stop_codon:yes gene_type:complete